MHKGRFWETEPRARTFMGQYTWYNWIAKSYEFDPSTIWQGTLAPTVDTTFNLLLFEGIDPGAGSLTYIAAITNSGGHAINLRAIFTLDATRTAQIPLWSLKVDGVEQLLPGSQGIGGVAWSTLNGFADVSIGNGPDLTFNPLRLKAVTY